MIENRCDNKDCEVLRKTFGDKSLKCEECPQYKDIQIKQLGERCNQLLKDKGELKAQIEKMKCGQNCKHSYLYQEDRKCKFTYCDCINCKDKWELRR